MATEIVTADPDNRDSPARLVDDAACAVVAALVNNMAKHITPLMTAMRWYVRRIISPCYQFLADSNCSPAQQDLAVSKYVTD